MILIPLELMVSVYRISRITNWEIGTVNTLSAITILVVVLVGTIILFILTKKWLKGYKARFWTVILWAPYFVIFVYAFASMFPITYGGDDPNPVTGFLAIGAFVVYPVYIFIVNFLSLVNFENAKGVNS